MFTDISNGGIISLFNLRVNITLRVVTTIFEQETKPLKRPRELRPSETRLDEISPFWQNYISLWPFLRLYLAIF